MSQSPSPPPVSGNTVVHVAAPPTNGLGIAGFVCAMVGIFGLCFPMLGFVAFVGLILSLIALRRPPRGLAIAGTIVGFIGSLYLFIAIFVVGLIFAAAGTAAVGGAVVLGDAAEEQNAIRSVEQAIRTFRDTRGVAPDSMEALITAGLVTEVPTDRDEAPLYLVPTAEGVQIWSEGPDQLRSTADDRRLGTASPTAPAGAASAPATGAAESAPDSDTDTPPN